jgi:hypothetical protein
MGGIDAGQFASGDNVVTSPSGYSVVSDNCDACACGPGRGKSVTLAPSELSINYRDGSGLLRVKHSIPDPREIGTLKATETGPIHGPTRFSQ